MDYSALFKNLTPNPGAVEALEIFRALDEEDKDTFKEFARKALREVEEIIHNEGLELGAIEDELTYDPVARYRGFIGAKPVTLLSVLKGGEWPETVTLKEAEFLKMGQSVNPSVVKKGRVPWEYCLDELSEHFKMGEQQLINRIKILKEMKIKADDLRLIINQAKERKEVIENLIKAIEKSSAGVGLPANLWWLSVEDLKRMCRRRGLTTEGSKADLVKMLEASADRRGEKPELTKAPYK